MKKLLIALCIVLSAAGCGKRGRLDFPKGAVYPRQYPAPRAPKMEKEEPQKQELQPSSLLDLNEQLEKESQ
ncbi:MAG TPA: hypothetical protein DD624_07600 [Alphaproteobacteria bacterium]|nr:hypothetical protein [Alphaproteobacteria bacterium]